MQQPQYVVIAYSPARRVRVVFHCAADDEAAALADARVQLAARLATEATDPDVFRLRVEGIVYGPGSPGLPLDVFQAPPISADSWLNQPRYATFRDGYDYASGRTLAIGGLSKIEPEEAFYIHSMIQRGIERKGESSRKFSTDDDGAPTDHDDPEER